MENRHGLVVDACVVPATGTGERDAATNLIASLPRRRVTIGGDKGYDTHGFVETLRTLTGSFCSRQRPTTWSGCGRSRRRRDARRRLLNRPRKSS
jgi:hypothetical protein